MGHFVDSALAKQLNSRWRPKDGGRPPSGEHRPSEHHFSVGDEFQNQRARESSPSPSLYELDPVAVRPSPLHNLYFLRKRSAPDLNRIVKVTVSSRVRVDFEIRRYSNKWWSEGRCSREGGRP